MQKSIEQEKKREEDIRKKMYSVHLEKQINWRKEREKNAEEEERKKEEIEAIL